MGPIPIDCNSLLRLDPEIEFCKLNCKWGKREQGKPRNGAPRKKLESPSKKRIKNPKSLCVIIEQEQYDYIATQSLLASQQQGKIVTVNDLIREGLDRQYPRPQQFDMFGNKK